MSNGTVANWPVHPSMQFKPLKETISPWAANLQRISKIDLIKIKSETVLQSNVGQTT
jgi:hypothetical protein